MLYRSRRKITSLLLLTAMFGGCCSEAALYVQGHIRDCFLSLYSFTSHYKYSSFFYVITLNHDNIMSSLPTSTRCDNVSSCYSSVVTTNRASTSSAVLPPINCSPPTLSMLESLTPVVKCQVTATKANADIERSMTLHQGMRLYPKAITWSVLLSMTLIMEGYSTILVPNLFPMDSFKRQFGTIQPNGQFEISPSWQSAFVNGGLTGQILGLFLTGILSEHIGYRCTLMAGLVVMTLFILVPFFATTRVVLLIGQCMLGIPWGLFQCICTVYAADVCPVALRAYLTTYVLTIPYAHHNKTSDSTLDMSMHVGYSDSSSLPSYCAG